VDRFSVACRFRSIPHQQVIFSSRKDIEKQA
jgi:hypothetical protein